MLQAVQTRAENAIPISRILSGFVSVLVCLDLCLCRLTIQRLLFDSRWKHTRLKISDPVPEVSYKTVNSFFMQFQHLLWFCL